MKSSAITQAPKPSLTIPMWEFVGMMAALMALNALATDIMLPALGDIGSFYDRQNPNDQQLVIFMYFLGFGFPQLIFGPLSDRFGRKGLLQICLLGYTLAAIGSMFVLTFTLLLTLRLTQGVFAAGLRVISTAIIRDLTSGRTMAGVLSLVLTIFMIVPIIAPAIGTAVMVFADWQWTFGVLAIAGILTAIWTQFRLPNTFSPKMYQPLNLRHIKNAYMSVIKTRVSFGYMLAAGVIYAALFTFLGSSEQIFDEVFHRGDTFWIWFGVIAIGLAIANLINSRIVKKYGMRRISHIALILFITSSAINLCTMWIMGENFWVFLTLFILSYGCFGMLGANFASLAMEPLGEIAGTASAAYGFATTTLAALIGLYVAGQFDNSVIPILAGYVFIGIAALLIVLWTEKGRIFIEKTV